MTPELRPTVAVIVFPGSNDDRDAAWALGALEAHPVLVWHGEERLPPDTGAVVLPGGFSYGDYLRCGAIARFSPVMRAVTAFAAEGGPVLGICNGFQVLCEAGLLPGALVRNRGLEFRCDWVRMRVENDRTPFTAGLRGAVLRMPIAHGEGCWVADADTVARVEARGQVVFRYVDDRGEPTERGNPNGSLANVAGLANERGNVVGLMPHPERCAEELLGGTDGYRVLANVTRMLVGTGPALYRGKD